MCLAIPARIIEKQANTAVVDIQGVRREADLSIVPEAKVGDYVLLHAGFALTVVSEQDARETFDLLGSVELDT